MTHILKNTQPCLNIHVGYKAKKIIQEQGLQASAVDFVPGAAGGPKGIGIQGLDQAVFGEFFAQAPKKRTLIGSSIGSWRFASIAAHGAQAGTSKLAELYTHLEFRPKMNIIEVGDVCRGMLKALLQGKTNQIIDHPDYHLAILAVKSSKNFQSDHPLMLARAVAGIIGLNTFSRAKIGHFMQRTIAQPHNASRLSLIKNEFEHLDYALTEKNLEDWLMASASIPFVMPAVRNIDGADVAAYRDGGLIDYHIDLPLPSHGIVLYPHFTDQITPGWFDKFLKKRRSNAEYQARTVLISPSESYLRSLPLGRLPDRKDFTLKGLDQKKRIELWKQSVAESQRLGDAFLEMIHKQNFEEYMQDLK